MKLEKHMNLLAIMALAVAISSFSMAKIKSPKEVSEYWLQQVEQKQPLKPSPKQVSLYKTHRKSVNCRSAFYETR